MSESNQNSPRAGAKPRVPCYQPKCEKMAVLQVYDPDEDQREPYCLKHLTKRLYESAGMLTQTLDEDDDLREA